MLDFDLFFVTLPNFVIVLENGIQVPRCKVAKDFANMQEKEQKISPIKQRILLFAESLNISKRDFYSIIGVSRGTLESKTGITEDIVAKFIASYPDVSVEWLIEGKGSMMKQSPSTTAPVALKPDLTTQLLFERDEKLIRENERLIIRIEDLEQKLGVKNSPPHYFDTQYADK